jgi:hypothetical protein
MSYLDPPRLHFAGMFSATISTVNNDPAHFDNATFKPEYQQPQTRNAMNGWFNPRGDADWRLHGCRVTSAVMPDGSPVTSGDPVLTYLVADSDRLPPAKLVDLDSEQQLVSTIYGLEMRICDASGKNLLVGAFEPAAFMDIWNRAVAGGGADNAASAMYQSVLTGLEWGGKASQSPFLSQLEAAASDGMLSVKLNLDGVNMGNPNAPDFLHGRITGTIGAAAATEPRHFVRGRQLMATAPNFGGFPVPTGGINNCVALVDAAAKVVHLDLGNALPTTKPRGPIANIGRLQLAYADPRTGPTALGDIPYQGAGWYEKSAGVVSLPLPSGVGAAAVAQGQLMIWKPAPGGGPNDTAVAIAEPPNGLHVRADEFVYYLDPGATATATLWASTFGQPYAQARIRVIHDPYQLQGPPFGGAAPPGIPPEAVQFPAVIVADGNGIAALPIVARAPGNPRDFIDGQVYGVRPMLEETVPPGAEYPFNIWEFVSVLVFDTFVADEPPTWRGSLQPIFQQYANLYPLMDDIVDLADYESVCAMREMMLLAFEQPVDNPNSMPVTRDLSTAKRNAILRWLREVGPDGKPLLGPVPPAAAAPPPVSPVRAFAAVGAASVEADGDGGAAADPSKGGKAAALARRLAFTGGPRVR